MILARKLRHRLLGVAAPHTLSSLDAYDLWAANYPPLAHNALMQAEQQAMLDLMPPLAGQRVLDLACGTGRYGLIAQECGARDVLGVDNSAAMLNASPLARRVQATTEAIPVASRSLDGVICGLALGHLPHLQPSLNEIARVLKPGGWALVSDFHPFIFLKGARRTFSAPDGQVYAVEHYAHLYADYHQAAAQAGLVIEAVREPALADQSVPVVIVYRFQARGRQNSM
jgi:malonyl-CoA O-methyltransferase